VKRQLVFIHGRAQEQKDAGALKSEWIDAFQEGLDKSNLQMPIEEHEVRFPFYGDRLYDLVSGKSVDEAARTVLRGANADEEEKRFVRAVIQEIRIKAGVTDEQLTEVAGEEVIKRGPLNWEWLQGILKAIDRFVPYGSGNSIALFTHDVYQYLKNSAIRNAIDDDVASAISSAQETIVVAHSLGTVVGYNVLRQRAHANGWTIPLFVTVGSPLAITEVRKTLKGLATTRCPEGVSSWFNALDERDVVALYPLDPTNFPLDPRIPAIENKRDVRNKTNNRHGIAGYLNDKEVAKRIHDALVA